MRVIASVYTGSTEKRALDELVGLGAKVKVSYETRRRGCTPRPGSSNGTSGFHTAYVGSSNLTHSALLDGLEWNVRATAVDNPAHPRADSQPRSSSTGTSPSSSPTTRDVDGDRLAGRAGRSAAARSAVTVTSFGARRRAQAVPIADPRGTCVPSARRGHFRNLVVAPTGTGKTWVSAFDYERLRHGRVRAACSSSRIANEILRAEPDTFPARPRRRRRSASGSSAANGRARGTTCSRRSSRSHRRVEQLDPERVRRRDRRRVPPRRGRRPTSKLLKHLQPQRPGWPYRDT